MVSRTISSEDIQVIFEDSKILVVNKPAGIRTIRDGYNASLPFLGNILKQKYGDLWVVHRLDRETSGVLIIAKDANTHRYLNTEFQNRRVSKTYHAIVNGNPTWDLITIDAPLLVDGDRHHRTIVSLEDGKPALTKCMVIERFKNYCLFEVQPYTGYTHQIRAHLLSIGFPITNDLVYCPKSTRIKRSANLLKKQLQNLPLTRLCLHAYRLSFEHPAKSRIAEFTAEYPDDFKAALLSLREII